MLRSPSNIRWKEYPDGVKLSEPALLTSGYEMRALYLPKNREFVLGKDTKTIVALLRGTLINPSLDEKESRIFKDEAIKAADNSLLFLCRDLGDNGRIRDELKGLDLEWIEVAKGCFRSTPKIEVDDYRINLWYLVPNHNGGIHNHKESTDYNISEQMIEVHVQLRGKGWMVKYREKDEDTEYERLEMKIGVAHPVLCRVNNGRVEYPWHAYVSGPEGALFIVFEDYRIPPV